MKQKLKQHKGITLIALIITIIVLLILAAVAIAAIKGDGIISHAKNAKSQYSGAQTNEQDMLSGYELMLSQETGNAWKQEKTKVTKGNITLNVGDEVKNFTAGGKTWKVLGSENGKLLLTTTENINDSFELKCSTAGWSETEKRFVAAEKALDDECKSKITLTEEEKKQVAELRSIRVEDINRVTGYDKIKDLTKVTYSINANGKVEYSSDIGESYVSNYKVFLAPNTSVNITSPYTVTSTGYVYNVESDTDLTQSSNAYKMLFEKTYDGFCLASSYIIAGKTGASWGMYMAGRWPERWYSDDHAVIGTSDLWKSSRGEQSDTSGGVRPVVSLKSDVKLTETEPNSGIWNIEA